MSAVFLIFFFTERIFCGCALPTVIMRAFGRALVDRCQTLAITCVVLLHIKLIVTDAIKRHKTIASV